MLELPLENVGPGHRSFAEVVVEDTEDQKAIGSMLWLAIASDPGAAGRFDPALRFLAKRSEAVLDRDGTAKQEAPTPTPRILENARALDRFLADGGCG